MDASSRHVFKLSALNEAQVRRLAEELAFLLRVGDVVTLTGDLGAGKTTFARFLIRSLARDPYHEVPSPTFTLLQTYETGRLAIAHFDLYRLTVPEELDELGFDHVQRAGAVLIEWPERADGNLPADIIDVSLNETMNDPSSRDIVINGYGSAAAKAARLQSMHELMLAAGITGDEVSLEPIAGDASARSYARLTTNTENASASPAFLVMDSPRQTDGPAIKDNKPYSQIAKLAENVGPFIAISSALRNAGLSAPEVIMADVENGFLVLEDLGDLDYKNALAAGIDQASIWSDAVDVLVELSAVPANQPLPIGNGRTHTLPRLDRTILEIETELVPDWLWPALYGSTPSNSAKAAYRAIWSPIIEEILDSETGWMLRDFHSPNLIRLSGREGIASVGIIDFQDALQGPPAYDLVSLLQDARLDVSAELETKLLAGYCKKTAAKNPGFDETKFRRIYALLGAQRNTKILGIFARLAKRDSKPGYLAHLPRIWGYLERNLAHPALSGLAQWYEESMPREVRARSSRV